MEKSRFNRPAPLGAPPGTSRRPLDTAQESAQLNEGLKASRHERADRLLDDHWEALCRYARTRVRDQAAVEDLVQETLLAAIRDQGRFRDESAVGTWLIGILRHKIADHWRQVHRREAVEVDQAVEAMFDERGAWKRRPGEWSIDPSQISEDSDFWVVMNRCLDGLPPQARSVFAMRVIDGESGDDVCKALEISATNLWVLLHRARLRLRACLEKHWFSDARSEKA